MESQNPQNHQEAQNEKPLEKIISIIDCYEKSVIFLDSNLGDSLHKIYYNRPFGYEAPELAELENELNEEQEKDECVQICFWEKVVKMTEAQSTSPR